MNKLFKVLLCVVFTFLFGFMTVGYAALSDNMSIQGFIGLSEIKAIYIASATQVDASEGSSVSDISYSTTHLTSKITLDENDPNAYVTLEIVVKNNTPDMEAGFNDFIYSSSTIQYITSAYSYSNPTGISHMDRKLSPGEFRTFRVTIKYKDGVTSSVNEELNLVNIEFIPWAVSGANAVFMDILNNPEKLEKFESTMDEVPTESFLIWEIETRDDSYISNAGGAAESDYEYINGLFEGNMTTFIPNENGELVETEMTIFIKRSDVDNNPNTGTNGKEMILFMTADELNSSGASAVVYAYVYTRYNYDSEGNPIENAQFELIGEMFEGTATVCDYRGGNGTGSFTTNSWKHTRDYYGLLAGKGTYNTNDNDSCGTLRTLVRVTQGVEDPAQYNNA